MSVVHAKLWKEGDILWAENRFARYAFVATDDRELIGTAGWYPPRDDKPNGDATWVEYIDRKIAKTWDQCDLHTLAAARNAARKKVQDWMREQGELGNLRTNRQAPHWEEYVAAEHALSTALDQVEPTP